MKKLLFIALLALTACTKEDQAIIEECKPVRYAIWDTSKDSGIQRNLLHSLNINEWTIEITSSPLGCDPVNFTNSSGDVISTSTCKFERITDCQDRNSII